jgi:hypothetical protein
MVPQKNTECGVRCDTLTIPELEQSKAAVLNTLASVHSRRSYAFWWGQFHQAVDSNALHNDWSNPQSMVDNKDAKIVEVDFKRIPIGPVQN